MQERLTNLLEQEYIGKHYNSSHKIIGKPATYFLLPKAIRFLKEQTYVSQKAVKSLYYDKRADEDKQAHGLNTFAIYNAVQKLYPDSIKFYAKTELIDRSYLTRNKPDALLTLTKPLLGQPNDFILDNYEAADKYWTMRRKLRSYIVHAESERWQKATQRPQPAILMVCETKAIQSSLLKLARRELETSYVDLMFMATTLESLTGAENSGDVAWKQAVESEDDFVVIEPFIVRP